MALRNVIIKGDPLLRRQSREIKEITDRIRLLADDMWETMYDANGVGLAAPQVGVLRRLIVIDVTEPPEEEGEGGEGTPAAEGKQEADVAAETEGNPEPEERPEQEPEGIPTSEERPEPEIIKYALVNPVILEVSEETETTKEGCLSVPGQVGFVERAVRVKVGAKDLDGKYFEIEGEGMLARALLHEIDHLDGVLFTDIAETVEDLENASE